MEEKKKMEQPQQKIVLPVLQAQVSNKTQAVADLRAFGKKLKNVLDLVEDLDRLGSIEAMEKETTSRLDQLKAQQKELEVRLLGLEEQRARIDVQIQADQVAATLRAKETVAAAEVKAAELIGTAQAVANESLRKSKEQTEQATKHIESTRKELGDLLVEKRKRTEVLSTIETKIKAAKDSIAKV